MHTEDFIRSIRNTTTEGILLFLQTEAVQIELSHPDIQLYRYQEIYMMLSDGERSLFLESLIHPQRFMNGETILHYMDWEEYKKLPLATTSTLTFHTYFHLGNERYLSILTGDGEQLLSLLMKFK